MFIVHIAGAELRKIMSQKKMKNFKLYRVTAILSTGIVTRIASYPCPNSCGNVAIY